MTQLIKHSGHRIFTVAIPNGELLLDFTRITEAALQIANTGRLILEHWQAPTELWGYYSVHDDVYRSMNWNIMKFDQKINCKDIFTVQVARVSKKIIDRPTACKGYKNCKIDLINDSLTVVKI